MQTQPHINPPNNLAPRFSQSENVARIKRVTPFDFHGFPVRVIDEGTGEPWFIAKDIAEALGYSNTSKAINAHCKAVSTCHTEMGGQVRAVQIIPERDLYRLVMKSKLNASKIQSLLQQSAATAMAKYAWSATLKSTTGAATGIGHMPIGKGRNAVQAVGSSTTYGKRYVMCALLNITTGEMQDDDGHGAGDTGDDLREQVVTDILERVDQTKDAEELKAVWQAALKVLQAAGDKVGYEVVKAAVLAKQQNQETPL